MRQISLVCINCPVGCRLAVDLDENGEFYSVTGNSCPRGAIYAKEEIMLPKRMLTTTVRTNSDMHPCLPVVSVRPVPKELLLDCINFLKGVKIKLPVKRDEIIAMDILGTGVDIVASRSLDS